MRRKMIVFLNRRLRVKPKTLAGWFELSLPSIYRYLNNK